MAAHVCAEGFACALLASAHRWKDIIPLAGSAIVALTAWAVASLVTRRFQRTDFFLRFAERYHNIMLAKHRLELKRATTNVDGTTELGEKQIKMGANELYRQYFGMMFEEFFAYSRGFLAHDIFVEWMMRHHDESGESRDRPNFSIAGIPFDAGWKKERDSFPANRTKFAVFFDAILKTEADGPRLKNAIGKIARRARLAHLVLEYWILWMVMAVAMGAVLIWSIFK